MFRFRNISLNHHNGTPPFRNIRSQKCRSRLPGSPAGPDISAVMLLLQISEVPVPPGSSADFQLQYRLKIKQFIIHHRIAFFHYKNGASEQLRKISRPRQDIRPVTVRRLLSLSCLPSGRHRLPDTRAGTQKEQTFESLLPYLFPDQNRYTLPIRTALESFPCPISLVRATGS